MPSISSVQSPPIPPFLLLPSEIRIDIYQHVFAGSKIRIYSGTDASPYKGPAAYDVLLTCPRIREEALPILAASTTIKLLHGDFDEVNRLTANLMNSLVAPAFLKYAFPRIAHVVNQCTQGDLEYRLDPFPAMTCLEFRGFSFLRRALPHGQAEEKEVSGRTVPATWFLRTRCESGCNALHTGVRRSCRQSICRSGGLGSVSTSSSTLTRRVSKKGTKGLAT